MMVLDQASEATTSGSRGDFGEEASLFMDETEGFSDLTDQSGGGTSGYVSSDVDVEKDQREEAEDVPGLCNVVRSLEGSLEEQLVIEMANENKKPGSADKRRTWDTMDGVKQRDNNGQCGVGPFKVGSFYASGGVAGAGSSVLRNNRNPLSDISKKSQPPLISSPRPSTSVKSYGRLGKTKLTEGLTLEFLSQGAAAKPDEDSVFTTPPSAIKKSSEAMITSSIVTPERIGFPNTGNTCYLNSVLQCLFSQPVFVKSLFDWDRPGVDSETSSSEMETDKENNSTPPSIIEATKVLMRKKLSGKQNEIRGALESLREAFISGHEDFRGFDQHDANEFLIKYLEDLRVEANGASSKEEVKEDAQDPVSLNFTFKTKTTLDCSKCGKSAETSLSPMILPLQLVFNSQGTPESSNLSDLLERAFSTKLERKCEFCEEKLSESKSEEKLVHLPRHLVLFLPRAYFNKESQSAEKSQALVEIPEILELASLVMRTEEASSNANQEIFKKIDVTARNAEHTPWKAVRDIVPPPILSEQRGQRARKRILQDDSVSSGAPPTTIRKKITGGKLYSASTSKSTGNGFVSLLESERSSPPFSKRNSPTSPSGGKKRGPTSPLNLVIDDNEVSFQKTSVDLNKKLGNADAVNNGMDEEAAVKAAIELSMLETSVLSQFSVTTEEGNSTMGTTNSDVSGGGGDDMTRMTEEQQIEMAMKMSLKDANISQVDGAVVTPDSTPEKEKVTFANKDSRIEATRNTPLQMDYVYRLRGVVNHIGLAATSGHYVADIFTKKGWLQYDDMTVFDTDQQLVLSKAAHNGYLFFYTHDAYCSSRIEPNEGESENELSGGNNNENDNFSGLNGSENNTSSRRRE